VRGRISATASTVSSPKLPTSWCSPTRPTRRRATLAADAYEQLGYLAESATWRNAYLFGAYELRHGPAKPSRAPAIDPQTISAIPTAMIFDLLAVQLNGPKADGRHITINWTFADTRRYTGSLWRTRP